MLIIHGYEALKMATEVTLKTGFSVNQENSGHLNTEAVDMVGNTVNLPGSSHIIQIIRKTTIKVL